MKRALLTLFAIFFLSVSSGATVHFHYCMGKLVNWGLTAPQKEQCDLCGMSKKQVKKNNCCKDDYKQAKIDNSKKVTATSYQFNPPVVINNPIFDPINELIALPAQFLQAVYANAPPEQVGVAIFIRNCTYRI